MPFPPEDAAQITADIIRLTKKGYSVADVCFNLCISQGIYFDWQKKDPEFKKAMDQAKVYTNPDTGQSASRRKLSLLSKSMKKLNGY